MAPVTCGSKTWPSRAAAGREVAALKARVRDEDSADHRVEFTDPEGFRKRGHRIPDEDLLWMYKLFSFHPRAEEKLADGVNEVAVAPGRFNRGVAFFFKSDTGVWNDISIHKCLNGMA